MPNHSRPILISEDTIFKNKAGIEFVQIPAGDFMMGCSKRDSECGGDEKPVHKVKITKSFFMGKYEVTKGQWKVVMGTNPSKFKDCGDKFTGKVEYPKASVKIF